jgi:osmotically-inducible protein OsmY
VAARIAAEPSLDSESIRVDVEGGTVMLHGSVRGMGAWQCAITNAGLVQGVRSVVDYLVLERGERNVQCLAPRPDASVIVGDP